MPLLVSSSNSLAAVILFFVAIFTPPHGTIALVAVGILSDYILRVFGIMIFKTVEIIGKKRERLRLKKGESNGCMLRRGTDSPPEDKVIGEEGEGDIERETVYERSRTMDSSMSTLNEEAPLGESRRCSEAVRKQYRIPGLLVSCLRLPTNLMTNIR